MSHAKPSSTRLPEDDDVRIPRIYTAQDLRTGHEILLPEQAGEHVARVLRLERGHPLILFNGDGHEYDAELATLDESTDDEVILASMPVGAHTLVEDELVLSMPFAPVHAEACR